MLRGRGWAALTSQEVPTAALAGDVAADGGCWPAAAFWSAGPDRRGTPSGDSVSSCKGWRTCGCVPCCCPACGCCACCGGCCCACCCSSRCSRTAALVRARLRGCCSPEPGASGEMDTARCCRRAMALESRRRVTYRAPSWAALTAAGMKALKSGARLRAVDVGGCCGRLSIELPLLEGAAGMRGVLSCWVGVLLSSMGSPSALAGLPAMSTSPARGVSVCCSAVLPLHAASAAGVAAGWGAAVVWMGRSGTSDTSSGHQRPQWLRGKRLHTYTFLPFTVLSTIGSS